MKIKEIKKKGNKAIITNDDGSTFEFELKLTENYQSEISNLSDEELQSLKEKSDYHKIKNSALRLLARRSHSVSELKVKLLKKDCDNLLIDKIIDELKSIGYLNDLQFAQDFVESKIKSKLDGINKIKAQLYKRGINKNIITEVITEKFEESEELVLQNALELAGRKIKQIELRSSQEIPKYKLKEKLTLYLLNKGYTFAEISKVTHTLIR